jgi:hypothetical protein
VRYIIRYLITKQQSKIKTQGVKVKRETVCGIDHCLVREEIHIPYNDIIKGCVEMDDVNLNKINNERSKLDTL